MNTSKLELLVLPRSLYRNRASRAHPQRNATHAPDIPIPGQQQPAAAITTQARRLLELARPERNLLGGALGLLLGSTTISLAVPKVMGSLIDSVMQGSGEPPAALSLLLQHALLKLNIAFICEGQQIATSGGRPQPLFFPFLRIVVLLLIPEKLLLYTLAMYCCNWFSHGHMLFSPRPYIQSRPLPLSHSTTQSIYKDSWHIDDNLSKNVIVWLNRLPSYLFSWPFLCALPNSCALACSAFVCDSRSPPGCPVRLIYVRNAGSYTPWESAFILMAMFGAQSIMLTGRYILTHFVVETPIGRVSLPVERATDALVGVQHFSISAVTVPVAQVARELEIVVPLLL